MPAENLQKTEILNQLNRVLSQAKRLGMALPGWIETPGSDINITAWLAADQSMEKYYWRSRNGRLEIGGAGTGFSLTGESSQSALSRAGHMLAVLPDFPIIFFSGRSFAPKRQADRLWTDFPDDICTIPRWMIVRRDQTFDRVCCVPVMPDSCTRDLAERVAAFNESAAVDELPSGNYILPPLKSRSDFPDHGHWLKNVREVLTAVELGRVEKVVLARRREYRFGRSVDAPELLRGLMRHNTGSFAALYQPRPGAAFVSVSPERLYRRIGTTLEIDALSSTVCRGNTAAEDTELAHRLLKSDKELREHAFVIEGIKYDIEPLCGSAPQSGGTDILKLEKVQHLMTPITGTLRDGVSDEHIMSALHPTPAVGGTPRAKALEIILNLEGFDRGWYAAPIGIVSRDFTEVAVGIRSALVRDGTVSVFSGAGIVAGSDPEMEWHEINQKDILRPLFPGEVSS